MREGMVVGPQFFAEREKALRAVGLSEQDPHGDS